MQRYSYLFGLAVAIILMISSYLLLDAQQKFYGSELYTPTKLEWFAVELNSTGAKNYTAADPYLLNYLIFVQASKGVIDLSKANQPSAGA